MNLGKSFSVSESDKYLLDFFERRSHDWGMFFIGPMHHHPPRSPTCVGNKPGGNPFALAEMGIHLQYTRIKSEIPSIC